MTAALCVLALVAAFALIAWLNRAPGRTFKSEAEWRDFEAGGK